jgi:hypothetical protein
VSTTRLQEAMQASRPAAGKQPSGDMATSLAEELGLSAAKVRSALQATMGDAPSGAPPTGTPPQEIAPAQTQES